MKIIEYNTDSGATLDAGKFLQIRLAGQDYLLFAPKSLHPFHNHILAHFLADRDLPHEWASAEELRANITELEIHGGGRFGVNDRSQQLRLWDTSTAYGRFNETGLVDQIHIAQHRWSHYQIEIGL